MASGINERWAKVHETAAREYFVSTAGVVLSVTKKHHKERKLTPYFKGAPCGGFMLVKLGDREVALKYLVLEAFVPGFKHSPVLNVTHKDGDIKNCALANLEFNAKSEVARKTGAMSRSRPVRVTYPDGSSEVFSSVRACGRALFVSYQTVLDYMGGSYKSSVLGDLKIEYIAK